MKNSIAITIAAILISGSIHGQAKQKKMLLQQIAALQVYIGYVQKGYSIAKDGLNAIGDYKRGEFGLHSVYFGSLKNVNPKVRNYVRVAEIFSLQERIISDTGRVQAVTDGDGQLSEEEKNYVKGVFERLLGNCSANLEALIALTTDSSLEMKDDERLKRIDILYLEMQDNYSFCQYFSTSARLLSLSRLKEASDIQTSRVLRGIN